MNVAALDPKEIDLNQLDLDALSPAELDVLEAKIAGRFMKIMPWGSIAWGFANVICWLALWPLVLLDLLPLWVAFPIALLNTMLAYLPSHEAQHSIIATQGHPLRWLNELLGHVSTIPLVFPYRVLRHTHMEHHAQTNDPELDPDYRVHAPNRLMYFWNSLMQRQPGAPSQYAYANSLERQGKSHMMVDALVYSLVFYLVLFVCAWTGYAIEAALLWWLPRHIATIYLEYYLAWAPHHPGTETGRYRDTRAFRSRLGNLVSMGMQFHIIHHLYPRIPLMQTPAAYFALKPILERKGCDLGGL